MAETNKKSFTSDMWAIGVITYFLLSGYTPFEGSNNIEEMHAIMNADYNFDDPCWENISQPGEFFILYSIIDMSTLTLIPILSHRQPRTLSIVV